ncbi:hypothetical protein [Brachyspira sp. G79]|uniref:tetratricopeptide repeat protein n=1 Tax=Brachyspira sp. G79 TaxID=1358104 RepID=UPI000BBCB679|nr:hypothetical protein [Brachyspira sp. G79]PCG19547.1 hypothetical protein KQ44_05515 [Brachyspira sp. G79]
MKKEHSITTRLILNFLIMSIIGIAVILIIYVLYSRGEGRDYSLFTYMLISLIFYKTYMPYIISLSVYFAFFKAKYLYQENISKVIAFPITVIIILVIFYTLYDYSFVDSFISIVKEHNSSRDAMVYYEYGLKLKNEAYEKSKNELISGNLDSAAYFAEEALFYDRNDGNVLLLIKSIQEEKRKENEKNHQLEISNINNLIRLGTREFSYSNYYEASKYFNQVIALDKYNPLALYYINKISIANNQKPKYAITTTEEASVYGRLSDVITLYENGRLWDAYDGISKLYMEAPNIAEVDNYYSIIRDSISRYDFFIREAKEIRNAYINNPDILQYTSALNHNGINLMLDKNTLLSSSSSSVFKNSFYIFDVSLIKLDDELKIVSCDNYLYGKIADEFKSTNNNKNIILKARFDTNKNDYIYSDTNSLIIPISISYSTLDIIKNYTSLELKYINLSDLFTLRKEIKRFGYSDKEINLELITKNIEPITYLLLFLIIAYYSFRYRLSMSPSATFHIYNRVTGVVGTILLALVYRVIVSYIAMLLVMVSEITLSVIIIVVSAFILILIVIFQMARIPRDVR